MDRIHVSTVVCLPERDVYDFLVDFPRYARYSEYLTEVHAEGDGSPGTRYRLHFAWWKLSYTAHTRVSDVDPPTRIDWRVVRDVDARGHWRVEPLDGVPASVSASMPDVEGSDVERTDVERMDVEGSDVEGSDVEGSDVERTDVEESACRVHLVVEFDPDSVGGDVVDLPRFVSFDWVVSKVKPLLVEEAERVVERIVADIEGRHRPVDLTVHEAAGV